MDLYFVLRSCTPYKNEIAPIPCFLLLRSVLTRGISSHRRSAKSTLTWPFPSFLHPHRLTPTITIRFVPNCKPTNTTIDIHLFFLSLCCFHWNSTKPPPLPSFAGHHSQHHRSPSSSSLSFYRSSATIVARKTLPSTSQLPLRHPSITNLHNISSQRCLSVSNLIAADCSRRSPSLSSPLCFLLLFDQAIVVNRLDDGGGSLGLFAGLLMFEEDKGSVKWWMATV